MPGLYYKFLAEENQSMENKIGRDLMRTIPGSKVFQIPPDTYKNPLFNVLKAYMCYDPEIMYCQGMNFIVAMLLSHIPNEEDVFWCLIYVMHDLDWR